MYRVQKGKITAKKKGRTAVRRTFLPLTGALIMIDWLDWNDPFSPAHTALKLALSLLLGGMIGWNRESKHKPAGIRTLMLISVGSAIFMLVSMFAPTLTGQPEGDPTRIAAQVVSGVGFLGAGVIMRMGLNVKGINTAASIWVVSAIGLAVGAGLYATALMSTAAALFTLVVLDRVEKYFFASDTQKVLFLSLGSAIVDVEDIHRILARHHTEHSDMDLMRSVRKKETEIRLLIRLSRTTDLAALTRDLGGLKNLTKIGYENGEF